MADLKIFTDNIEETAVGQIMQLLAQPAFRDKKVRIMPDVHAGVGCVIGFTADLGDKVIPNIVGVDIGCGMHVIKLGKIYIDLKELDEFIHKNIPAGFASNKSSFNGKNKKAFDFKKLFCFKELTNINRIDLEIGTLGGGNHFIEVDVDLEGNKYLVIHTGSRNLGKQVACLYQDKAISYCKNMVKPKVDAKIKELKEQGRQLEIDNAIKEIYEEFKNYSVPNELCYLEGELRDAYLHDMKLCQEYAVYNREVIASRILSFLNVKPLEEFESIHNYIDDKNMVRKGAISAHKGEKVIIPLNMRDGSIIGYGKGNPDWNESAPHGAGRILSRGDAKRTIKLEDFKETMKGIYTTSVGESTIDESPMAYKPSEEIINQIADTVEISCVIKPIYNFKAGEE